jgi:hypothetical protein
MQRHEQRQDNYDINQFNRKGYICLISIALALLISGAFQ